MVQGSLFGSSTGTEEVPAAEIAVEVPVEGTFLYRIPLPLRSVLLPGMRVSVPFSGRRVEGICLEVDVSHERNDLLEIREVLDRTPLVPAPLLALIRWIAEYYLCPVGEVFAAALPRAARVGGGRRKVQSARMLVDRETALRRAEELLEKRPKQARVLRILAETGGTLVVSDLLSRARVTRSPIRTLERSALLTVEWTEEEPRFQREGTEPYPRPERLSPHQEAALSRVLQAVQEERRGDFLLWGVTGSGKTEVYLQAIEAVIAQGKGAVVLVPEIALTPQTIARFDGRFPRVAVLHSGLTESERYDQWRRIQEGRADVVIGARSAVFAPHPRLGLIVVDEEHETSFKQQNAPRYHARDVALKRAEIEGASVILGSATPSLEAYHLAGTGRLTLLELPERVGGGALPRVKILDLSREKLRRGTFLSPPLRAALSETLARKEQAILFLNRRGFYPVLFCPACKETVRCKECAVTLTLHRESNRLICHYCGFEIRPPEQCPSCGAAPLRFLGAGTERIEHEVRTVFPQARVLRMDSDTMMRRGAHAKALDRFKAREVDVLIGTQMIAKGLDFPLVTLVGVVSADTPLHQPDFRAAERTFQLLSQVAGRAGRSEAGGRVMVQTFHPAHYGIRLAVENNYRAFAQKESAMRKEAGYAPFLRLLRIVLSSRNEKEVESAARLAAEALCRAVPPGMGQVLGPAPAPITMINGRHRRHLLVKSQGREGIECAAAAVKAALRRRKGGVRLVLDVDPQSML